ncbi:MAG: NYN domain-containing protein [Candidatus Paceibacterota bacterium]
MSVIKHSDQRVAVFIDTQNLYHSAKNLYNTKVNFGAVMQESVGKRKLIRALAYVITTEAGDETNFFEALTKIGIETKTKDLQIFYGGAKKADWDVGLAVDAIRLAPKVDTIILATGDGDFVPLVIFLKEHFGVQVEVISFGRSSSSKLREACEDFIDMCDHPEKFLMGYRAHRPAAKKGKSSAKKSAATEYSDEALGIVTGE